MENKKFLIYFILTVICLDSSYCIIYPPPKVIDVLMHYPKQIEDNVEILLKQIGIVPNVIPVAPNRSIDIAFPCAGDLLLGRVITVKHTEHTPFVNYPFQPDTYYTVALIKPSYRIDGLKYNEFVHWLLINIPAAEYESADILVHYIGAIPPNDKKLHLYVFLVFPQRRKYNDWDGQYISSWTLSGRNNFSIYKFSRKMGLGKAIAASFFFTRYDIYVKQIYRGIRGESISEDSLEEHYTFPPHYDYEVHEDPVTFRDISED